MRNFRDKIVESNTSLKRPNEQNRALTIGSAYLEGEGSRDSVALACADLFENIKGTSRPDEVMMGALSKILGLKVKRPTFKYSPGPAVRKKYQALSKAWLTWASGADPRLILLNIPKSTDEIGNAIEAMTLETWGQAIEALAQDNLKDARRLFHRAIELSVVYGTESSTAIQWSYLASFYHSRLASTN